MICWVYDVTALEEPGCFARGLDLLPWEERREKVLRFRFESDRRLSLGAGLLLAYALRQAGAEDLTLGYNPYGKPFPAHCEGIHFSLSHSGTLAVCAVGDAPVGADVEKLRELNAGVARRCFTENELRWLKAQPDPGRAFTRLWTRKESFLKWLGTGLSREMRSFSACPASPMTEECNPLGLSSSGGGTPAEQTDGAAEDSYREGLENPYFSETEVCGHLICVCSEDEGPKERKSEEGDSETKDDGTEETEEGTDVIFRSAEFEL